MSSGKIDRYQYLTGEAILPTDQRRVIEQAKFTYSCFKKTLEKQRKTIEGQGIEQFEALKTLKPKEDLKALKLEENQGGTFSQKYKNL